MQGCEDRGDAIARFYPFVLTGALGERIYGAALIRTSSGATHDPTTTTAHGSSTACSIGPIEALCFLSRFPVFSLLHDLLFHLHHISRPESNHGGTPLASLNHHHHHQPQQPPHEDNHFTSPSKKPQRRRSTASTTVDASSAAAVASAAAAAADAVARAAASSSRAGTVSEVHLQVVLNGAHGAPLGIDYQNYDVA